MLRSKSLVALLGLAFVISQANLAWLVAPLRPNILALQLAFTATEFWSIIKAWGTPGVALFRSHFAYDLVHPFVYGAFGYFLVANTALFSGLSARARCALQYALPVAAAFDLTENAIHFYLLSQGVGAGEYLVPFSATCSSIKWGLAAVFSLALIAAPIATLIARIRARHAS
jgi:hypothetical protein